MKFLLIYVPNLRFREFNEQLIYTSFEKVIKLYRGSSPRPIINYVTTDENGVNWIKIGDMPSVGNKVFSCSEKITKDGSKKSRAVYKGDIILSNSMSFGKPYILGIDGFIHDGWFVIRDYKKYLDKTYLCQLLSSDIVQNQYKSTAAGGVVKNISSDLVNSVKFHLPSIIEQRKIARFLESIDQRIETQIKIIDDYNSLKMGIYNCMFKENYADYKLKQLAYIVKGDQINNDQLLSNGSYYMMNGGTSPSGYIDSYNVSENTISISEGGNSCGYVQFNSCPFWSGGHCYTIQNVNSALIENKYLYHYLKYKEKEIMNLRIGTGLPNIQKKDLENFTILVPSLLIQRKNLALFEMLDEKISILNEELANLQKQKKYLLCNMFI